MAQFLNTETGLDQTNIKTADLRLNHTEIDYIQRGLGRLLNTSQWNMQDPAMQAEFEQMNQLYSFIFKAWEATTERDPIPIVDAEVADKTPAEFTPNLLPEDANSIVEETHFDQPAPPEETPPENPPQDDIPIPDATEQ
jgi:hypothetical protein